MSHRITRLFVAAMFVLSLSLLATSTALAQRGKGPGRGGRGPQNDPAFVQDRDLFHYLLEHRSEINRQVKDLDNGIETLTESDNPKVAEAIQRHVASMEKRVKEQRPIHLRDPLFAAIFQHANQMKFVYEKTDKGMRVVETSDNPFAVKLLQAHARVVSLFIQNGFEEVHRNHEVPKP